MRYRNSLILFFLFLGLLGLGYRQVSEIGDLNRDKLDGCYVEFADNQRVSLDLWPDHPLRNERVPVNVSCYFNGEVSKGKG